MSAADVRRTLGMSAHTLTAVEFGPGWPSLTSIVRVATLFDMVLTLVPADTAQRQPPWPMPAQQWRQTRTSDPGSVARPAQPARGARTC